MSDSARLTFFAKTQTRCPICDTAFSREELRTGRGRLIAGKLSDDLRRHYEASKKFGEVNPLIYPISVCPSCFYSALPHDFSAIPEERKAAADKNTDRRVSSFQSIAPAIDFNGPRGLKEGLASHYFAMVCYDFFPREFAPTFKQGLCALRAAWLCDDLDRHAPGENWDFLAKMFYRKARFFYSQAVEKEQNGTESIPNASHLGPDLDKNYGYDGVLYITGWLEYEHGPREDDVKRRQALARAKRTVSRLFGMGRASKSKPSIILDMARDLYAQISDEMGEAPSEPKSDAGDGRA
ncbi:MAG TPA: DUF2225 domain-containing protein [Spirochaetia bacterium]|nr:DUF2225 domain-containing protein [Spirochaetia bacterium]